MALSENILFKFGNYEFPSEYIKEGGYECKPNQRQDLDPYTDATGLTHRNALQHTKTEVAITTRANLKWDEMVSIIQGLTSNYITDAERDAQCEYFDTERLTTSSGHMYLESSQKIDIQIYGKKFPETTFTFVEY